MLAENIGLSKSEAPSRVLLVEDDAIIAINAEMMLQQMGVADVQTAGTVAEALVLIDGNAFDFAVLDFSLGEETSVAIAQRLCAAKVPVVITTGYADVDLPEDCSDAIILNKPYRLADLKRVVLGSNR